jgi:hypothetical protein
MRRQRRVVLAAVDLDFAFGGLALTFDAPLAGGRLAFLALEDAARFPAGAPEVPPDPLLETVLACRSTAKLSPTPGRIQPVNATLALRGQRSIIG